MKGVLEGGDPPSKEIVMEHPCRDVTTAELNSTVKDGSPRVKHPKTGRPYTEMPVIFQADLELLAYLRENHFKTFIVSGGGIDSMRQMGPKKVHGIPPEQVVAAASTKVRLRDGKPVLVRLPEINFIDDKAGKPVGIRLHIGRRPIAAFGNSVGDQQMLEWTEAGGGRG